MITVQMSSKEHDVHLFYYRYNDWFIGTIFTAVSTSNCQIASSFDISGTVIKHVMTRK